MYELVLLANGESILTEFKRTDSLPGREFVRSLTVDAAHTRVLQRMFATVIPAALPKEVIRETWDQNPDADPQEWQV